MSLIGLDRWIRRPQCSRIDSGSLRAGRDGSPGIAYPFAPRSDVQSAAGQAGVLQREQVVAGRDAGPAHADDFARRASVEALRVVLAQGARVQEAPIGAEVLLVRVIHRARHM